MTILIIEDEQLAAKRLLNLVIPYFPGAGIVDNLDSIQSSVNYLRNNPFPDLIFCDIQLADGSSFEIFNQMKLSTPIIFTTAFDNYAIKAFEVNAIDYLLKPIDVLDLEKAITKFQSRDVKQGVDIAALKSLINSNSKNFKSRFLVKYGEKIQSISIDQISFFFSEERITFLQTHDQKKFVLDGNLEKTEALVDPKLFFRLNRKYLISSESIEEISVYSNSRLKVRLRNCGDPDILVSREKVNAFKDWLDR